MKLSELCREHIKRIINDDWCWVDGVVIQKNEDMTLVYFKSIKRVTFSEDEDEEDDIYDVTKIIWFNRNGKILMIDGRFSVYFHGRDIFLELIRNNALVELDYDECSKIENVFFNHIEFTEKVIKNETK
jgi:hypothetical protein